MAKLTLDLHDIFNKGRDIDSGLNDIIQQAVAKRITVVEIIPGKGSGQLKKHVLRFLQQSHIKKLYHRVEKDDKNFGRIFVHFRYVCILFFLFVLSVPIGFAQDNTKELLTAINQMQTSEGQELLSTMGMAKPSGFSMSNIMGNLIFGAIGFVAFVYGKKNKEFKPLIIGVVLMGYSYFVPDTMWMYVIGAGLTAALYIWRG